MEPYKGYKVDCSYLDTTEGENHKNSFKYEGNESREGLYKIR